MSEDHQQPLSGEDAEAATPRKPRPFHIEEALAALIMATLCVITFANVLTRYFTNISFAFTEEFSVFLVVVMTLVGAATAFTRGHHLAITFFPDKLSARGQVWQKRFALACALLMFGVLTWWGGLMWWDDFDTGITSPGLGVPQWWYTLSMPLFSALIELRLLQLLFKTRA